MFTGILLYMYSSKITSEKLLINIFMEKNFHGYIFKVQLWNKLAMFIYLFIKSSILNTRYNYIFTLELILTSKLDINKQSLHSQLLQDTNTEDIYSLTLKRSKAHCCLSSIVLITSRQFQQQICMYFLTIYCYNPGFFD